jgi:hypothetical protein
VLLPGVIAIALVSSGSAPAVGAEGAPERTPESAPISTVDHVLLSEGQTITTVATDYLDNKPVTVVTTDALVRDFRAEAEEAAVTDSAEPMAAAKKKVKCWTHKSKIAVLQSSVFRNVLYKWRHVVTYCFKGKKTHKLKSDKGKNLQNAYTWEFKGNRVQEKNRTKKFFYRELQGHYQQCLLGKICSNRYPTHGARYMNNGKVKTYIFRNK